MDVELESRVARRTDGSVRRTRVVRAMPLVLGRWFTAFVMMLATPGPAQIVEDIVSSIERDDCCDEECGDGDEERCPGTCGHCSCCAHISALPTFSVPRLGLARQNRLLAEPNHRVHEDRPFASGDPAPPFRPPAV